MNDLEKYFKENAGRVIHKYMHYFDAYDRHFSRYRGTDVCIVEFGVSHGGSLRMWKEYFGDKAKIYGVDINPNCKQLEEDQVEIMIGDQEDRTFLKSVAEAIPRIDILIDDGGHSMKQQINTFEELFPCIQDDGVYLCEDMHTSYWDEFGGGYKQSDTFVEYSKNFVDYINAWYSREPKKLDVSDFTRSAKSLHYYDSILVIEKQPVKEPVAMKTGIEEVPSYSPSKTISQKLESIVTRIKRIPSRGKRHDSPEKKSGR